MVEEVETGGLMKFRYDKNDKTSELTGEQKLEIKKAYGKYDQRRHREKKNKAMLIFLILIIVIGGLLAIFLK